MKTKETGIITGGSEPQFIKWNTPNYVGVSKKDMKLDGIPFDKDVPFIFYIENYTESGDMTAFLIGSTQPFIVNSEMFDFKPVENPEQLGKDIQSILHPKYDIPTDEEIQDTIAKIEERLNYKPINRYVNAGVKEGYQEAVKILREKRTTYEGLANMKTVQGRAIAMLTIDYLNGNHKQRHLIEIKITDR